MLVQNEIPVFTAEIPNLVAFDKASAEGVPVYEVDDPRAQRAWEAYELAGKEIL
jgi:chromosome partitioning protein